MSSTLSEGVRVPDIGSVNWGADVNFNWGLLNTCLANISGNVKVDVENTWTAPQTFSETISGSIDGVAARAVGDEDGNNIKTALAGKQPSLSQSQLAAVNSGVTAAAVQQIGTNASNISALGTAVASKAADDQVVHLAGAETITGDKTFTGAVVTHNITPETDNTYSLGSSSYQWASVYAQSYYYKGTAWGLDKENHWSFNQWVENNSTPKVLLKDLRNDRTYSVTDKYGGVMRWECVDKDNAPLSRISTQLRNDKAVLLQFAIYNENSSGAEFDRTLRFVTNTSGEPGQTSFYPEQSGTVNLGASGNKWLTFNGINPGALSLPDYSNVVSIDTTDWDLTGATSNSYTPTFDGYLSLRCKDTNGDFLFAAYGGSNVIIRNCAVGTGILPGNAGLCLLMPIRASISISIQVKATTNFRAYIIPCLGNV